MLKPLKPQIERIRNMKWKQYQVRLFYFGDYKNICDTYGLSGAKGVYFCLWCLTTVSSIHQHFDEQEDVPNRKLSDVKKDYKRFFNQGKNQKKNAKKYNNIINEPLVTIPISHVCPPYLHILLGVVKRHHDLLVEECYQIDLAIALELATDTQYIIEDSYFSKHVDYLRKNAGSDLQERKTALQQLTNLRDRVMSLEVIDMDRSLKAKISKVNKKIRDLQDAESLDQHCGPVVNHLDCVLQTHKIQVQAYHSRSFVGNHCAKYTKVYPDICQGVIDKAVELSGADNIKRMAEKTCKKFKKLNHLYSLVHQSVAHSFPIPTDHMDDVIEKIDAYMLYYRNEFPNRVLPKQHILENHVPTWISRWGVGMGLHGEQGGESVHAEFNQLQVSVRGIRNPLKQLMALMREHHTKTSPVIQSYVVPPKKRKIVKK